MKTPTCNHVLGGDNTGGSRTGLMCVLPADHKGPGHVYVASSGMHGDAEPASEDR